MQPITLSPFPDPYQDAASLAIPLSHRKMLRWSEQIWLAQRSYAKAVERLIAYFITQIDIAGIDDGEERRQEKAMHDNVLSTPETLKLAGIDAACYGAGFLSVIVPFLRTLVCPRRGCIRLPLREAAKREGYKWQCPDFIFRCPICAYSGVFKVEDIPVDIDTKMKLHRRDPHTIDVIHNLETGDNRYLWRIPEDYRALLRSSNCDVFHLERANLNVIKAVAARALFEFHPDTIHQVKQDYLGGLPLRGWGIPHPLLNHRRLYLLQVLHRLHTK